MTLRAVIVAALTIASPTARTSYARQQPPATRATTAPAVGAVEADMRVDAAVAAGLEYLAQRQRPDGTWDAGGPRAAMTGLALMTFLAGGHTPDVGRYGPTVRRAVDALLALVPADDAYFGKVDGSRMYGHGIATLALIEAMGVEPDATKRDAMRAAATRCVRVIEAAQDVPKPPQADAGGWRYEPTSGDSDLSLTGWCALSLKAAHGAGINVPKERAERATAYALRCWNAAERGFAYQPGAPASVAMTGVGVLSLHLLGSSDRPEAVAGAEYLLAHPPDAQQTRMPYYSFYYATQAGYHSGEAVWPEVWRNARAQLLSLQSPEDGGWPQSRSPEEPGRVYATSMAVLTLSVPYRLLPVYQR